MTSQRFEGYLESRNRQRRNEATALATGLTLMAVALWIASNWDTIVLLVALCMATFITNI